MHVAHCLITMVSHCFAQASVLDRVANLPYWDLMTGLHRRRDPAARAPGFWLCPAPGGIANPAPHPACLAGQGQPLRGGPVHKGALPAGVRGQGQPRGRAQPHRCQCVRAVLQSHAALSARARRRRAAAVLHPPAALRARATGSRAVWGHTAAAPMPHTALRERPSACNRQAAMRRLQSALGLLLHAPGVWGLAHDRPGRAAGGICALASMACLLCVCSGVAFSPGE